MSKPKQKAAAAAPQKALPYAIWAELGQHHQICMQMLSMALGFREFTGNPDKARFITNVGAIDREVKLLSIDAPAYKHQADALLARHQHLQGEVWNDEDVALFQSIHTAYEMLQSDIQNVVVPTVLHIADIIHPAEVAYNRHLASLALAQQQQPVTQ